MARGGSRQGQPGKGYTNRTDLNVARAPQTGTNTAAAAGQIAPVSRPSGQQPQRYYPTPDSIPRLDDPTARPDEPITAGLPLGPGPEAIGRVPVDPMIADIRAAYLNHPTPQLERVMRLMASKGII